MKVSYLIAALIFALGVGLLIFGTTGTEEVTLLGVTFHPRIAKGLGVITAIFSVITFLAMFGNAQPPARTEHPGQTTLTPGGTHDNNENISGRSNISRRP
jgi:hypothetical protein